MSKIEDLENVLVEYWKKTEEQRKLTHTAVIYENLKNKKKVDLKNV